MCVSALVVILVAATGLRGICGDPEVPLCCPLGQEVGGTERIADEDNIFCNDTSGTFIEKFKPLKNLTKHHHPITCSNMRHFPYSKPRNVTFSDHLQKLLSRPYGKTMCFDFAKPKAVVHFCIDLPKIPMPPGVNWTLSVLSVFSIVALLATAFLYSTVKPLTENSHSPYIVAHNLSLAMTYVSRLFLQIIPVSDEVPECQAIAFILQFFTLAAFFWMNAMCLDVHITIRRMQPPKAPHRTPCNRKFILLSLYGWGVPLIITIVAICFEFLDAVSPDSPFKPNIGRWKYSCFFTGPSRFYLLKGPMAFSAVVSVALFIATAIGLYQHEKNMGAIQRNSKFSNDKRFFILYLKLFLIMGLSWGLGWALDESVKKLLYLTKIQLPSFFSYVFFMMDIIFCLQGVFIFLLFVCKQRTLSILFEQFRFDRFPWCSSRKSEDTSMTAGDTGVTNSAVSTETIL